MIQLDLFPMELDLRRIDPAQNKQAFYALSVERTLFGEWVLVREWGRIGGGGRGRRRRSHYRTAGQALDALYDLARKKRRRGFFPLDPPDTAPLGR